jgi:hypothetical protein
MADTGALVAENERNMAASYAYQVDPPTQPAKDEELVVCSTTCPSGKATYPLHQTPIQSRILNITLRQRPELFFLLG